MTITKARTAELVKGHGKGAQDSGATEVQIAILTERINNLTGHLGQNKKDHSTHRGQMQLVSRRRRLLDYLKSVSPNLYLETIAKLGIRK